MSYAKSAPQSIAGGLSAENLDRLDSFLLHDPDLCWDAEGGLRTSDDHFSLEKATNYVNKSLEIAARAEEMKVAMSTTTPTMGVACT